MSERRTFSIEEAREIGDRIGVDWNETSLEEFRAGLSVELEHGTHDPQTNVTSDDAVATGKIALAHLKELPDYYTRLTKMEAAAGTPDAEPRLTGPGTSSKRIAGLLLLLAGVAILMGIITAETQYPAARDYSTADNEISDLGATRPPNSVITHPSSDIFNATMLATGALIIAASVLLLRTDARRHAAPYVILLFGAGVLGVGIFPGNNATIHPLVAMVAFVFGGLSCVTSSRIVRGPFRWVSVGLGSIALVFLFFAGSFIPVLGDGGTERWIAYPVVLWVVAFGAHLLGTTSSGNASRSDVGD